VPDLTGFSWPTPDLMVQTALNAVVACLLHHNLSNVGVLSSPGQQLLQCIQLRSLKMSLSKVLSLVFVSLTLSQSPDVSRACCEFLAKANLLLLCEPVNAPSVEFIREGSNSFIATTAGHWECCKQRHLSTYLAIF
jgi:hypothetical protein